MLRLADLDAVTLDAFGTLVELPDPTPALAAALREHGIERRRDEVQRAFEVEGRYYKPRSYEGRDTSSLAMLQRDCAHVFLKELDANLDATAFASAYLDALRFSAVTGVEQALRRLRAAGLELAVVANWDVTLSEHLAALGLSELLTIVVTSAEAGVPKPHARPFELALERLAVPPERALHVGDSPADEEGARAAGMHFRWAPVAKAVAQLR